MIIGEGKPIKEILAMIEDHSKILLAGCRGCVTVCCAGGEKEVGILSAAVSLARETQGKPIDIKEVSLERQCDPEYLEEIQEHGGRLRGHPFHCLWCGCSVSG